MSLAVECGRVSSCALANTQIKQKIVLILTKSNYVASNSSNAARIFEYIFFSLHFRSECVVNARAWRRSVYIHWPLVRVYTSAILGERSCRLCRPENANCDKSTRCLCRSLAILFKIFEIASTSSRPKLLSCIKCNPIYAIACDRTYKLFMRDARTHFAFHHFH